MDAGPGALSGGGRAAEVTFATKPEIALGLIQQAISDQVPPAPVLGDHAYGINGAFRDGLRELGLEFYLQVDAQQLTGWAQPVALERKRTRWQVREPHPKALSLVQLFAEQKQVQWHPGSWKAARRTNAAHAPGVDEGLFGGILGAGRGKTGRTLAGSGFPRRRCRTLAII